MKKFQFALALGMFAAATASAGPIYYLFNGDSLTGHKVDVTGGTVTTFSTFALGYPVAIVGDKIRLHDRRDLSGVGGVEYDLNGAPTGTTFAGNDSPVDQLLDGTTDGTYNYAVQCCGGQDVWRADLSWQGFTPLFTLPTGGSGITYDPTTTSLWVLDFSGNLTQYSMSGSVLSSFSVSGPNAALAYDAATDTLFAHGNGSQNIYQISKTGSILNTYTLQGLSNNIFGGEILSSSVPEPASMALLALGLGGLAWMRRRVRA